jgi:DNA polymerase
MITVIADFETANANGVDLKKVGTERYALDAGTSIICLVLRWDDGTTYTWTPGQHYLPPKAYDEVEAHNAFFEQMIWKHILTPEFGVPYPARWSCSMAKALYKGLAGALDTGAKMLRLGEKKDREGSALTISMSKTITKKEWAERIPADWADTKKAWAATYEPRARIDFATPDQLNRIYVYCKQDCVTEGALSELVGELSPYERRVWELDNTINHRGIRLDTEFIRQGMKILARATDELNAEFKQLTGINPTQVEKLKLFCADLGLQAEKLDKAAVAKILASPDVDPSVKRALEIRAIVGSSSVAKLPKMLAQIGNDGRSRGTLQYYGAHTGRWSGRGWQPQNMPARLGFNAPHDELYQAIMTGSYDFVRLIYADPIKAVASGIRQAIIAEPGNTLGWGDFAGIEMRGVLGLAGQHDKTEMLSTGVDVYSDMAVKIFGLKLKSGAPMDVLRNEAWYAEWYGVTKIQRTIGKNTVLGCGFQMGGEKFHARYCPEQTLEFASDVVQMYRKEWAPLVPSLWTGLEDASVSAVYNHGHSGFMGIEYKYAEYRGRSWLACILPDGQIMYYFDPQPCTGKFGNDAWDYLNGGGEAHGFRGEEEVRDSDGGGGGHQDETTRGQPYRTSAYGGSLTENVVQKMARGFLVEAMFRLEDASYPVVLTVHDEIMCEAPTIAWQAFRDLMQEPTRTSIRYAIPIAVEGAVSTRYRK